MSNNKQSMKLYTDEEIRKLLNEILMLSSSVDDAMDSLSPIELPINGQVLQDKEMYYIQNGFSGNAIVWWAKDSKGYTSNLNEAGKFTKEFAFNQVACGRSGEYAWPCSYVDGVQNKPICIFGSNLDISERIDYEKIQRR